MTEPGHLAGDAMTDVKQTDWTQPVEVDDIEIAFPALGLQRMPAYDEIPDDFRDGNWRRHPDNPAAKWLDFQSDWFANGWMWARMTPRSGVDPFAAMRHLHCIQGSYAPKHEHKMAGVAYLASLWFEDILAPEDVELNRPAWAAWTTNEEESDD